MPHLAQARSSAATPLLFALSPQDEPEPSDSPRASARDQTRQKTPQKSPVSKSLPHFNQGLTAQAFGSPACFDPQGPDVPDDVTTDRDEDQMVLAPLVPPLEATAAERASNWLQPSSELEGTDKEEKEASQLFKEDEISLEDPACYSAEEDFCVDGDKEEEEESFHDSSDAPTAPHLPEAVATLPSPNQAEAEVQSVAVADPEAEVQAQAAKEAEAACEAEPAPMSPVLVSQELAPSLHQGDQDMSSPDKMTMSPMMLDCPPTEIQLAPPPSQLFAPPTPSQLFANDDMMEVNYDLNQTQEVPPPPTQPQTALQPQTSSCNPDPPSFVEEIDEEMTAMEGVEFEALSIQGLFEPPEGLFEPLELFSEGMEGWKDEEDEEGGFEALLFKHHNNNHHHDKEEYNKEDTNDDPALFLPPLEATPSPHASPRVLKGHSPPLLAPSSSEMKAARVHQVRDSIPCPQTLAPNLNPNPDPDDQVRDSIPLFTARQSFAVPVGDSVALDHLSLEDIAPFSRKRLSGGPTLSPLAEEGEVKGQGQSASQTPASINREVRVSNSSQLSGGGGGGSSQGRRGSGGGLSSLSTPSIPPPQSQHKVSSQHLTALGGVSQNPALNPNPNPGPGGFLSRLTSGSNIKPMTTSRLPRAPSPSPFSSFKPPLPIKQEPEAMDMTPPPPSPRLDLIQPSAANGNGNTSSGPLSLQNEMSPLVGAGWGSLSINMSSDDTSSIADEARRLFGSLLASVAVANPSPYPHSTQEVTQGTAIKQEGFSFNTTPLTAPSQGGGGGGGPSVVPFTGFGGCRSSSQGRLSSTPVPLHPSSSINLSQMPLPSPGAHQMMEMQVNMMIQRLADAESLQQQLEKENEGLRDQLSTLQFIHEGLGGGDKGTEEMERSARQCAEEQLSLVTRHLQVAEEDLHRKKREVEELRSLLNRSQRAEEEAVAARAREIEEMKRKLADECQKNQTSSIRVEALTTQLCQSVGEIEGLRLTLAAEKGRVDDLQSALCAKEEALVVSQRMNVEAGAKLQKALEGLTNAQVAQRRQVLEIQALEGKASSAALSLARVQGERDALAGEVNLLKARDVKSDAQEEVMRMKAQLAAAAAENKELLGICNQLLAQVEAGRSKQ